MIQRVGKLRGGTVTHKQLGVEFEILDDDALTEYLGDIIGNDVGDEDRFGTILEKMEKLGER